jgi:hypothetical protein
MLIEAKDTPRTLIGDQREEEKLTSPEKFRWVFIPSLLMTWLINK